MTTEPNTRHAVSAAARLDPDRPRVVLAWFAWCDTCRTSGPDREHRMLAAHDADRHRPTGAPFPTPKTEAHR